MRVSATEASPAVVQVVKAHLQRQPDAQVRRSLRVVGFCVVLQSCTQSLANANGLAPQVTVLSACPHSLHAPLHFHRHLQAQQAFQAIYPQLAEQHSQVLAAALNNSASAHASSFGDSSANKLCNTEAAADALMHLEKALAAAASTTAAGAAAATTASQVGLTGAAASACGDGSAAAAAAAASGPVQALLQLAATAGGGLDAVDKVCCKGVYSWEWASMLAWAYHCYVFAVLDHMQFVLVMLCPSLLPRPIC